jgi:hypothetical protein
MNEWLVVKVSKIFGRGCYAAKDIPKGTSIIEYKGKHISKELSEKLSDKMRDKICDGETGTLWIFTLSDEYDINPLQGGNDARFINHSCEPNCEPVNYDDEEIWIEAIKDIKKGDELTYNYGFDEPDELFPCFCGSKTCRGWIVSEDYEFAPGEKEELEAERQKILKKQNKKRKLF